MSTIETRQHQMFPTLAPAQVEAARRFASGDPVRVAPGKTLYQIGDRGSAAWLVLEGTIDIVRRDGLGHEAAITTASCRQFSGEVSQLAGNASLAEGRAGSGGCLAVPFDAAHLRALIVGSAEVGEIVMRAFILRRVGLIESDHVGSIIVGRPGSGEVRAL